MSIPVFFEPVMHAQPAHRRQPPDRRRRHAVQLPGLAVRREGRAAALADVRDAARRARPEGARSATGCRGEEHGVVRGSVVDYIKALASTMMAAHDRLYLEKATFVRTIPIPTVGVGTTEFDITPERVRAIYESGRRAARSSSWTAGTSRPTRRSTAPARSTPAGRRSLRARLSRDQRHLRATALPLDAEHDRAAGGVAAAAAQLVAALGAARAAAADVEVGELVARDLVAAGTGRR